MSHHCHFAMAGRGPPACSGLACGLGQPLTKPLDNGLEVAPQFSRRDDPLSAVGSLCQSANNKPKASDVAMTSPAL